MPPAADLPLALAITGASGAPYWMRLLEVLLAEGREVHLVASSNADTVARAETGLGFDEALAKASAGGGTLRVFDRTDFNAPKHDGISFLLFDMASPGVSTQPITLVSGSSPFS